MDALKSTASKLLLHMNMFTITKINQHLACHLVEFGVQCAMSISPILMLKLFAANLDIPPQTPEPTIELSTDQEAGQSGWNMLVVLALNLFFLLVIIVAGGLKTVHTVMMSEFRAVSDISYMHCFNFLGSVLM